MSEKERAGGTPAEEKPGYETPLVIPLGELPRGAGHCADGSSDESSCAGGGNAYYCLAGPGGNY